MRRLLQVNKSKWFILMIVSLITIMSISLVGCSSASKEEPENKAGQTAETPQDLEKEKTNVQSAILIAENKLTLIFEDFTPEGSDTSYLVAKSRYKTLDDVKKFLSQYYTENGANEAVSNYVKMEDVLTLGQVPTLQLPEDYFILSSHTLTEQDTFTVEGDQATLTVTDNGKTITYTVKKVDDKWLLDNKTIK